MNFPFHNNSWFIKYKLYHIPFWLVYHYTWWSITIGNPMAAATNMVSSPYAIKTLFYIIFQAIGAYFNLYYLIPRLLEKAQYIFYILALIATILITAAFVAPGYYISSLLSGKTMEALYNLHGTGFWYFYKINTLPSTVTAITVAMSVKLTMNWLSTLNRERLLKQEQLETELKFLRSQFNPHFLFNTINSIFVLIHKNPDKASAALAKFSELLRYQLYECNDQQIPLIREIGYVKNFIELERLRQEKDLRLDVDFFDNSDSNSMIAPFMLMPFIENAFKHVSRSRESANYISIKIHTGENLLQMNVTNSADDHRDSGVEVGQYQGIGLKNIERRLSLIYPGSHELEITNENKEYRVALKLTLSARQIEAVEPPKLKIIPV